MRNFVRFGGILMSESLMTPPVVPPPLTAGTPIPAAPAATADEPQLEIQDDEGSTFWRDFLYASPTWAISMLVHICLVLGLAMHVYTEIPKQGTSFLTVSSQEETTVETDFQHETLPPPETPPVTIEAQNPADTAVDTNVAVVPEKLSPSEMQSEDVAVAEIGDTSDYVLDSSMLKSFDERAVVGNAASFFGVKSKGKKFCFVVDNSGSMKGGKFKAALSELSASIDKLKPDQSFYIIFFSHQPFPLFYPESVTSFVPATPKNKERLAKWLPTIEFGKATKGKESLEMALEMSPDVVYVLGDGEFTDNTVKVLMAREYIRTKIFTVGFNMKPDSKAEKDFKSIAERFYGVYRNVEQK